jgi:soluble lytic murein transglycosylase
VDYVPGVRTLGLALVLLVPACTRPSSSGSAPPSSPPAAASAPASPGELAPPSGPWRELVRDQRWAEAEKQIDALPESDRKSAPMRYVRARIASERKDHAAVIAALDGLEKDVPLLAEGIVRMRSEAQASVGPFEPAALYFQGKTGAKAQTRAAEAWSRAGKPDEARKAIDRAIAQAKGGGTEAAARAVRLSLAEVAGQKDAALADAKWILREAPEAAAAKSATEAIARLDPSWKPTAAELLSRGEKLAAAGKGAEAIAAIDLAKAADGAPNEADFLHARGMALFKVRRYAEAVTELSRAAEAGGRSAEDDAFHAARAMSRAGNDEGAIRAYRAFEKEHPKSPLADEAGYLVARLSFLTGKKEDAQAAYATYLKRHKGGKHRTTATYELALVELADHPARARAAFSELARAEDSPKEAARLRELEGVAAEKAGDAEGARAAFVEVIAKAPLSFSALAAAAHLSRAKQPVPPPIESAESQGAGPMEIRLPPVAAQLHALGLDDEAEDALRAREKELGAGYAPRTTEALCALYGTLDQATRRYRIGSDGVKEATLLREPSGATRWAWDCLYPRPYLDTARAVEARESLPRGLVHAVMRQESAFDVDVISGAHAVGLLQLLPTTARELAKRSNVPFEEGSLVRPGVNIDLGARYLAMLLKTWKGNVTLAVASYNAGPQAISRWVAGGGPVETDVFVARIPYPETRTYVMKVIGNLARYSYLEGGAAAVPALDLALDPTLRAEADAF